MLLVKIEIEVMVRVYGMYFVKEMQKGIYETGHNSWIEWDKKLVQVLKDSIGCDLRFDTKHDHFWRSKIFSYLINQLITI